jgi:dTDP-4-dehydrorhamnose reductase
VRKFRMDNTRILVTGASGLLGVNLALVASQEHRVFGLVNEHSISTIEFTVIQGDLSVPGTAERLLDETQPDWVIHCAALADLDACEADPARASQLNTEVPRKLAQLVAKGGARLLHVSTDAVFDGQRGDYCEEDDPNPIGVYARTKLEAERAVAEANPEAIIARVNLFGFSINGRRSLSEFFLNNIQAGKRVMGFTDVFFCPLLVNDLAQLFLEMLEAGLSGLYHVVSSECLSKYEFGLRIARRFELDESLIQPASVHDAGLKAARAPNLKLHSDKLSNALGRPSPTVSEGLERFYQLYQLGYPQRLQRLVPGS